MIFPKYIPLMVPDIQESDIEALVDVLRSGKLVQGLKVEELEIGICKLTGSKHAIAVSNGTASLHLALVALGIGKGDEVIIPAFSYIATANAIELVGATPIFVDIDLATFNINKSVIEKAITTRTKAIMPVHEFGLVSEMNEILAIAKKHQLFIIEDAACALGATENEKHAGTFGDVGSFSFHPRKAITGGEGGVLVTDNEELAAKLRILRNHGIEIQNGKMEFVLPGFNYRMTDFQAALISNQLKRLPQILETKSKYAARYQNDLKSDKISVPRAPMNKKHTWQTFHVLLNASINRDAFVSLLNQNNIGSNYGAQCIPYQQFYKNKYRLNCGELFPNSLFAYNQGLALPIYEKLSLPEIEYIIEKINAEL